VKRLTLPLALLAGWVAAMSVSPDWASAARPVKGALYAEGTSGAPQGAYLRVSKSGRSLSPRRSMLDVSYVTARPCGGGSSIIRLGSRRRPVRITRSGRFRFVLRRGHYVFRLRGHFTTKNTVKLRFRFRREPRRARPRACDDTGPLSLVAKRVRRIPFRDCRTHRATTVLSAPTGRVFWQQEWGQEGWMTFAYACLYSANQRFKLHQDQDDDSDLANFRLVGPYLAYSWHPCGGVGCISDVVEVRDLRDGSMLRRVGGYGSGGHSGSVSDLELKQNGSVAVIGIIYPYSEPPAYEVWAYDTLGWRRLDRGNISQESLGLDGSTLTWVKDGVVRSATLY
jgi:hypothetical protein